MFYDVGLVLLIVSNLKKINETSKISKFYYSKVLIFKLCNKFILKKWKKKQYKNDRYHRFGIIFDLERKYLQKRRKLTIKWRHNSMLDTLLYNLKLCSKTWIINFAEKALLIATNLTSLCYVYKEKIVKNYSGWRTQSPYKLRKLQHSTRIVNKSI